MRGTRASGIGIGLLIIFIGILIIAVIVGHLLIQQQMAFQEDSLNTADGAKKQVTTQLELIDLSAEDGRDGSVDNFKYVAKLKPGAEPISLRGAVMYVNTYNDTLRLIYREGRCARDAGNGFYTVR
jgi:archaellin